MFYLYYYCFFKFYFFVLFFCLMDAIEGFVKKIFGLLQLPGPVLAPLVFAFCSITALYFIFQGSNNVSYWASGLLFFVGSIVSYNISRSAGFDGALNHFREVIIGSTNIGLISIKKLSDTPPEEIASQTKNNFAFIGIAGEKFLKKVMDECEFFRKNNIKSNVRIILMDPFSDDIKRLSKNKAQQSGHRKKIISTLNLLADLKRAGYKFEVRLYPRVPPLRLMISDSAITALSVYTADENGWKNAQLIFDARNCPDSLAPYFYDLFDDLWERALGINLILRANSLEQNIDNEVDLGMVHGRFQPFHHEHFEYVLYGVMHSKKCLIGITQPVINDIKECDILPHRGKPEGNPYSFEERKNMITLSLDDFGIDRSKYEVIPFDVDDIKSSSKMLLEHTSDNKPVQFMKVFSDWELHKKSKFEEHGFEVRVIRRQENEYSPKNVTGTLVRELISSNRNWKDFVPAGTKKVISKRQKNIG